jgi:peroxiredoxin family protein
VPSDPPDNRLGILLLSGAHDRAHYAFMVAAAAAALGRRVVLFATNAGCRALLQLLHDWSGLSDAARDRRLDEAGVAGIGELREAVRDLGVRLIACEAGLRAEGIDPSGLLPDVEVAGLATFFAEIGTGQVVTL